MEQRETLEPQEAQETSVQSVTLDPKELLVLLDQEVNQVFLERQEQWEPQAKMDAQGHKEHKELGGNQELSVFKDRKEPLDPVDLTGTQEDQEQKEQPVMWERKEPQEKLELQAPMESPANAELTERSELPETKDLKDLSE